MTQSNEKFETVVDFSVNAEQLAVDYKQKAQDEILIDRSRGYKEKQLEIIDNGISQFHSNQFLRMFIYHVLFYMVLGPFLPLILICFERTVFIKNMDFVPSSSPFYLNQAIVWLFWVVGVFIAVKNHYDREDEDSEIRVLDTYPLYITLVMLITRCFIIAIRYGSMAPATFNKLRTQKMDETYYKEQLMIFAWIALEPS